VFASWQARGLLPSYVPHRKSTTYDLITCSLSQSQVFRVRVQVHDRLKYLPGLDCRFLWYKSGGVPLESHFKHYRQHYYQQAAVFSMYQLTIHEIIHGKSCQAYLGVSRQLQTPKIIVSTRLLRASRISLFHRHSERRPYQTRRHLHKQSWNPY
jgi:hypothetical protein